ncbi:hypothetical protein [Treponema saccharophilum]|uniref:Uncharacterized protein n=1 Tax=Treponema saccharophilum DSM 2985 TaxID=907348 RepID=H7EH69_9SPIR|nr:hypothetical protein [Treponema saccharophilum]EIC03068.1 hypothetical protein TresaDRAFT_2630 [Treponema saccharophilum DSM 2985]BDC96350.1 hypothetical protein TRSA_14490 [Treponema saccharophilum]
MLEDDNLYEFSYDDEYDENFMEPEPIFTENNDFENACDELDSLDDEFYDEMFDDMGDTDDAEPKTARGVLQKEPVLAFSADEEFLDDFDDE